MKARLVLFLPLIISHRVPEGDQTWELVLELKDLVELLSTPYFTPDSLCYLESKISIKLSISQSKVLTPN